MDSQHEKSAAATQARPSHTNRLIDSSSPYLLQHAHNPVEWYPWGNEALEKARRENKPIFLSIGYAACHWCHVMEREVFEKPELAAIMNEHFVNIKVDREERPDLDDLYMMATQVMSGSGGWPMSVWLTPSLEPFYAGTYFPAEDGFGRPGFRRLDLALADAWKNRRGELEEQARRVVEAIRTHADESAGQDDGKPRSGIESMNGDGGREAWVRLGIEQLADRVDEVNGGLGSAPKFPPHQALLLWATVLETGAAGGVVGAMAEEKALAADGLVRTLDGMMRGGIYDHVGGAFARYSTDERWLVPHFEKMLYDSAQLAPVYALASVLLGRPDYARVARETLDFYMREMMNEKGAFYSSLDADSEGVEGKYYVWTVADVKESLESDGDGAELVTAYFGMAEGGATGNWHESPVEGGYVLAVGKSAEALARERNVSADDVWKQLEGCLRRMRTYRKARVRPGLDDKILTGWNALMVSALAVCGRVLREPKYLEAAHQLIGFLLTQHMEGGRRLMRVSRGGMPAHTDAFLDDHAYLLNGLMDLIDSTTATSLPGTMARKRAWELADTLIRDFEDASRGGFYFTAQPPRHEKLFARMKNAADNATPSANGVAIRALLRLAQVSGKEQYREVAMRAVGAFAGNIARRPEYFPTILAALIEDAEATRRRAGGTIPMGGLGGIGMQPMPIPGMPEVGHHGILQLHVNTAGPIQAGKAFDITVRLTIAEGYHVQLAEPADREAFRTVARLRSTGSGAPVAASQAWDFPPGEKVDGHNGYKGKVEFRARCRAAAGISAGEHRMRVTVMAQPCSGVSCLPPERASAEFTLMVQG